MYSLRFVLRLVVLGSALGCTFIPPQPPAASDKSAVSVVPEVRLRKLHLVRPDLIPYPLYFEVLC